MRDLSKVNQKSLQQTWELLHAALIPCPFTLQLQQLTWERLVCPTGSPSTNPKETFCDCQAKSLKMIVGQGVTISLTLHAKEKTILSLF